jgi:hypothetical protein
MKLLTKPTSHTERVEWKRPAHVKTSFNPLGIFGIGSLITSTFVPEKTIEAPFPGRTVLDKVEIDFEDEDAITACIEVIDIFDIRKKHTEFVLMFDEWVYILHGVFPEERLRDNVWRCNIDHFEY